MMNYKDLQQYSKWKLGKELDELLHKVHCWYNICKYYHIFHPTDYLEYAGYDEALTKADKYCYLIVKIREELDTR